MKGQTALEMVLLAALIIVVAGMVYVSYSGESADTIAETTIRTQANMILAKGALTNASCANAQLIYFNETTTKRRYELTIVPDYCGPFLFTQPARDNIQGRISEALGCRYEDNGTCQGKNYIVSLAKT
ncbi:hypothetical protein ACFLQ2_02275 [archaeon]